LRKCAVQGSILEPGELWAVREVLGVVAGVRRYIRARKGKVPSLYALSEDLSPQPELERAIEETVDPEGRVQDSASPELRRVRRALAGRREALRGELERLLASLPDSVVQERVVTIRNGRYVVPIKASQVGRVQGVVHDQSASGATLFVEPLATLPLQNEVRRLELEERREVERVLAELTALVRKSLPDLSRSLEVLGELDALYALASYGAEFEAHVPKVSRDGRTVLISAKHPILLWRGRRTGREVVPLDVEIGGDVRFLLITGPNAGGKTVALKTIGLLTLMTQAGFPVPASPDTEIAVYRKVFADIGDEQSLEGDISTFAAHVGQWVRICRKAGEDTLVLLDELGTSTDPDQGASLAMALLDYLLGRGAKVIATTHLGRLKLYAHGRGDARNASMEFDRECLTPTFRLQVGLPGSSYAYEISERLGLPTEVVSRAQGYTEEGGRRIEELLWELEELSRRRREEAERLERLAREQERLKAKYKEKLEGVREEAREIKRRALEEAERVLREANTLVERTVAELRAQAASRKAVRRAREEVRRAREEVIAQQEALSPRPWGDGEVGVGDAVVTPFGGHGVVVGPEDSSGRLLVQVGSARLRLPRSQLRRAEAPPSPKSSSLPKVSAPDISPQVDLRGMTFEEAAGIVDKYLDNALLANMDRVVLIHGKGTGALREKLWEYLRGHPKVKFYRSGDWNEGGDGVTVVELT
ncbi:MAG TPA: endonuclease MutS2, partial [Candidatus Latescibacteria bacterium]|nr:endonuclease MutS2 [Candidatus Latescibacterota bacterium]